ncbi:MAG: hypothetical protein LW807_03725 [Proteobacteria bacterium]|jgi:hypothetical protein|nr:hypothetical protein [Pseudomonadota bacterium]
MKFFYAITALASLLVACAQTPNNVTMSINQGQCIAPNTDGSSASTPVTAPYCMSVTLQNNNTGQNANNVQVTSGGITLSYNPIGELGVVQPLSSSICDPLASGGVCPSGTNQIGNINIYDPSNCATQQGSKVTTLMADGGTCTFYLQIVGESYAVGSYPINLTYNYTNANQNYSISTNIFQNVNLYAGGSSGVFTYNNGSWSSGVSSRRGNTLTVVNSMIYDSYGNLYFNSANSVYKYNGLTTILLGEDFVAPVNAINSLTIDGSNNLIAATNNGLYFYNSSSNSWSPLNSGIMGNIIGVAYGVSSEGSGIIYGLTATSVYSCTETVTPSLSLSCTAITDSGTPTRFYNNALLVKSNAQLYVGTTSAAATYNNPAWSNYTLNPNIGANNVSDLAMFNSNLYLGINSTTGNTIYVCDLSDCIPQMSTASNGVSGAIASITTDGAGYLYGVGSGLSSGDIPTISGGYSGVFLNNGNATALWQRISGNAGSLVTVRAVSSLGY